MTHASLGRDPYPFPRYQNDANFVGNQQSQKGAYGDPTHIAQQTDPWNRLNKTHTLSSGRREVYHYDPQAPNDALDFELKAEFNQGGALFADKHNTLMQKETVGKDHGRVLKNREVIVPPAKSELNHPLKTVQAEKQEHPCSIKQAIEGHHIQATNKGYSRKPNGTFYS